MACDDVRWCILSFAVIMEAKEFIPFLESLTQASARAILPHYGDRFIEVDAKEDDSPVTIADREAEASMRALIHSRYPDHGILGEELGNDRIDAEYVWILDPIDGTKSFISGVPLFTTLIGLLHRGRPVLGAIHQPVLGRLCIGDNEQCWLNGEAITMRRRSLRCSTLLTSDPYTVGAFQSSAGWEKLIRATSLHRSWGDGYGYMMLATGWADVMCDPVLEPWDLIPVLPVVQGAGARVTDWQGKEIICEEGRVSRSSVCAHPDIHNKVIALLNNNTPVL